MPAILHSRKVLVASSVLKSARTLPPALTKKNVWLLAWVKLSLEDVPRKTGTTKSWDTLAGALFPTGATHITLFFAPKAGTLPAQSPPAQPGQTVDAPVSSMKMSLLRSALFLRGPYLNWNIPVRSPIAGLFVGK